MPQIPRQQRRRIRNRAQRQANREFRPQIKQARKGLQRTKKQRGKDLRSVSGAADYLTNALNEAMGNVKGSGLKGRYKQQVLGELGSMQGDALRMVPLERQSVRQEYASPMQSARAGITDLRVSQAATARDTYASALAARRAEQAKGAAEANEARRDRRQEVTLAVKEGTRLLTTYGDAGIPKTPQQWAAFEAEVAKAEGIGLAAARRAVQQIKRQFEQGAPDAVARGAQTLAPAALRAFGRAL